MTATLLPRFGGLKNVVVHVHQEPSTARFRGVANWSAEKKWGNSVKFCAKVLTHPQIIPGFCRQTMKSCNPKMGTMGIDPVLAVTRVFVWM
jgi:hypothetical protein